MSEDGREVTYPRRASVSSFGAYGANAHLILEEYIPTASPWNHSQVQGPQLVVLSAQKPGQLRAYAQRMANYLQGLNDEDRYRLSLTDIAYTLQIGREAMAERVAMVVEDIGELQEKLTRYIQGQEEINGLFRGNVKPRGPDRELALLLEEEESKEAIKSIIRQKKLEHLARLWVAGVRVDWKSMYPGTLPRRISLPTYPFERERYWWPVQGSVLHEHSAPMVKEGEPDDIVKVLDMLKTGQLEVEEADQILQTLLARSGILTEN